MALDLDISASRFPRSLEKGCHLRSTESRIVGRASIPNECADDMECSWPGICPQSVGKMGAYLFDDKAL